MPNGAVFSGTSWHDPLGVFYSSNGTSFSEVKEAYAWMGSAWSLFWANGPSALTAVDGSSCDYGDGDPGTPADNVATYAASLVWTNASSTYSVEVQRNEVSYDTLVGGSEAYSDNTVSVGSGYSYRVRYAYGDGTFSDFAAADSVVTIVEPCP